MGGGAGSGPHFFTVVRYNSDGTQDTSFDGDGVVSGQFRVFGNYYTSQAAAVKIQPDGKIVVAGTSLVSLDLPGTRDFAVARLNPNGSFDTTFDEDGIAVVSLGQQFDNLYAMDIQPDGKIILAGNTSDNNQNADFPIIARLTAQGALDATFSGDGVISYVNEIYGYAQTVLAQPDGKILLINTHSDESILRYNADGSPDASFGVNGRVTNTFRGASSAALQSDGKILLAGSSLSEISDFIIYRYNQNGSLDTTFNYTGAVSVSFGDYQDGLTAVAVQADGKIIAAGYSDPVFGFSDDFSFAVARLNSNGSLDKTFDLDGKAVTPVGSRSSEIRAVAVQKNGKIVTTGNVYLGGVRGRGDAALVGYMGDLNTADFDGDTKTDVSVFRLSSGAWYYLQSSGGNDGVTWGFGSDKPVPGDYTGDGKTDVAVFRPNAGQWFVLRSENATYYAVSFGTAEDQPVSADYDGDGRTDIAVFRPSNGFWYQLRSKNNQFFAQQFGQPGDLPQIGDFNGDGISDLGIYRGGNWYLFESSGDSFRAVSFGNSTDRPVPADFDGDGKTDVAVVRSDAAQDISNFYILRSSNNSFNGLVFGNAGDVPVVGDYDGDGKADVSVFRQSNGAWYLNRSTAGFTGIAFGQNGDKPIPGVF